MKRIAWSALAAIALGGLMALTSTTTAQENPAPPPAPRRQARQSQVQRLTKELNLTAEQQAKLKTLFQERNRKVRALRQNPDLSRQERREKSRAIREEVQKQMKALLSADQWNQYQKIQQQARERRRQRQNH